MGEQGGWQEPNRGDWAAILDSQTQIGAAKVPQDDITEQARNRGDIEEAPKVLCIEESQGNLLGTEWTPVSPVSVNCAENNFTNTY
ncbi:uncharacterized protein LOC123486187 isoform X2 [Coregonus clupeaformis]|uniref:uncharacterized protein LOC123486187 isoform X2 n=1 Tax=Coregonus clupeaformis TaxID=59861 RepID=UPI001E1C6ED3|nr:uncharacterized protein LOC123486187 isoform X2 [Coregonus clupeaformis]